jgi:ATP-dependent DNA helicase RecQ
LRDVLAGIPVLALTATATRPVARDILHQLGMRKPRGYKGSFFRPNLRITCHRKGKGETRNHIQALVEARRGESGIVYCLSRKTVEQTTEFLCAHGIRAVSYHAGLADTERQAHQEAFARDDVDVVVATIAFGMGIDKSNVRYVIHRDMPRDVESWVQEIGRAGRDGLPSDCIMLYSWADVKQHERFIEMLEDPVHHRRRREAIIALYQLLERGSCRHQAIVHWFDEDIAPCGDACDACSGDDVIGRAQAAFAVRERVVPVRSQPVTNPADSELFDRLRTLRKRLADEAGVPAYIVVNDRTLREMAARRPASHGELLGVPGIGPAKSARWGDAFLEEIAR